jgi:hypothetical protein
MVHEVNVRTTEKTIPSTSTAGRTNWSTTGATFDFGQHFIARGRWHPFWRAMLGVARLEVTFRGSFNGYSIQDAEGLFPITEPAVDNVTKIIPVVAGKADFRPISPELFD